MEESTLWNSAVKELKCTVADAIQSTHFSKHVHLLNYEPSTWYTELMAKSIVHPFPTYNKYAADDFRNYLTYIWMTLMKKSNKHCEQFPLLSQSSRKSNAAEASDSVCMWEKFNSLCFALDRVCWTLWHSRLVCIKKNIWRNNSTMQAMLHTLKLWKLNEN